MPAFQKGIQHLQACGLPEAARNANAHQIADKICKLMFHYIQGSLDNALTKRLA